MPGKNKSEKNNAFNGTKQAEEKTVLMANTAGTCMSHGDA